MKLHFLIIQGDFGPFSPGMPVEVPIWLAVTLKQRNKCKINCPAWLDVGKIYKIHSFFFVELNA